MAIKLKLSQKVIILVSVPLVLELGFLLVLNGLVNRAEDAQHREYVSKQAVAECNQLLELSYNQGLALFSYIVSRNPIDGQRFDEMGDRFAQTIYSLKMKMAHNEPQLERLRKIEETSKQISSVLLPQKQTIDRGETLIPITAIQMKKELQPFSKGLIANIHDFTEAEQQDQANNPELEAHYRQLVESCLQAGIVLNLTMAFAFTLYYNKGISSRLAMLMDNIARFGQRRELNPPIKGSDEISQLDNVFREMANALAVATARERAIVENVADVIITLNSDYEVVTASQAARTVLGYEPADLGGKKLADLLSAPSMVQAMVSYLNDARSAVNPKPLENQVKCADGSPIDISWSVRWSDKEKSFYCVAHNVSAQKQLQRMKEELMAMVSHDLRSPLSSLSIFLELVDSGVYGQLNNDGRERTQQQFSEVERLIGLINSLLDMEKLEAGKLDLVIEPIGLDDVIRRSLQAVAMSAERASVEVIFAGTDVSLDGDAERLIQVLVNFLSNAIKYSPPGGRVTVSCVRDGDFAQVNVADSGCGIPSHLQQTIFERFEQVNTKEAKRKNSSGLGLSISKLLIEQHGGSVGVDSEEGKGSTFWFRLPMSRNLSEESLRTELTANG